MPVQHVIRVTNRQGTRWEVMKSKQVAMKRKRKTVDERGSFEKFVDGVTFWRTRSCIVLKSCMQFCKSRMFRKKSFDISPAGLMARGGARGGPFME